MRLLGVDFGFKRIGLAVAETEPTIVTARPAIEASGTLLKDATRLVELARKEEAGEVVVGLPLEDGEEGRMARICRTLAGHIEQAGFKVHLVDETLTSVEADARLRALNPNPISHDESRGRGGSTAAQRRKHRDGEAACLILERYLEQG